MRRQLRSVPPERSPRHRGAASPTARTHLLTPFETRAATGCQPVDAALSAPLRTNRDADFHSTQRSPTPRRGSGATRTALSVSRVIQAGLHDQNASASSAAARPKASRASARFQGAEVPKRLPYSPADFQLRSPWTAATALAHDPRAAPSKGAVTGLSYPTISAACAGRVPPRPDFSSGAHGGFPPCRVAHLRGTGSTRFGPPLGRTEHRLSDLAGASVSPRAPCPRRPTSSPPAMRNSIGSNRALQP